MKKACEAFETPVTGGNVSFYNQSSDEGPVFPTPTIGMLGILENPENKMTLDFKKEGDAIYLVGESVNDIASSEYVYSYKGIKATPAPHFDLATEQKLQKAITSLIENKLALNNKAGYYSRYGKKPINRGVARNPVDHPHGGRAKSVKYQRTP